MTLSYSACLKPAVRAGCQWLPKAFEQKLTEWNASQMTERNRLSFKDFLSDFLSDFHSTLTVKVCAPASRVFAITYSPSLGRRSKLDTS